MGDRVKSKLKTYSRDQNSVRRCEIDEDKIVQDVLR